MGHPPLYRFRGPGGLGTAAAVALPGDSAWPLIAYCLTLATASFLAMAIDRLVRDGR
jgi:hypothetical protein